MGAVVEVVSSKPQVSVCLCSNVKNVYFKQCSVYQIIIMVFVHRFVVKTIAVMWKMEEI